MRPRLGLVAALVVLVAAPAAETLARTSPGRARGPQAAGTSADEELRRFLAGRELTTRVPVGGQARYQTTDTSFMRRTCLVVDEDGSMSYLIPGGMYRLTPIYPTTIGPHSIQGAMAAGTRVRVTDVGAEARRLSLTLQRPGSRDEACLRMRLPTGWQHQMSLADLLRPLDRALDVGVAYQQLVAVEAEHETLASRREAARDDLSRVSAADPEAQLAAARKWRAATEAELGHHERCAAQLSVACPDAAEARADLTAAQREIARLDGLLRDRLVADARAELAIRQRALQGAIAPLPGVDARGDLAAAERDLTAAEEALHSQREALGELERLGARPDPSAVAAAREADLAIGLAKQQLGAALTHARHARRERAASELVSEMAAIRTGARSGGLDARQQAMERWENRLSRLRRLIQEGQAENQPTHEWSDLARREQAALDLERERLATDRTHERTAALDTEASRLRAEVAGARGRYTAAFMTAAQRERAVDLHDVLERLLRNRERAATLGSGQARDEAATLQDEVAQLRRENPGLR